jgi:hypothetical protein
MVHPDLEARKIAGDRQGHADAAALGCRVRRLADPPSKAATEAVLTITPR